MISLKMAQVLLDSIFWLQFNKMNFVISGMLHCAPGYCELPSETERPLLNFAVFAILVAVATQQTLNKE